MREFLKCAATLLTVSTAAIFSGCSTAEPPQYQGRSRATPVIEDYYPSKTNQPVAKPPTDHHAPPIDRPAVTVPEKTADIFRETEKHFEQLAAAVQTKDARQAHQHDNAIRTFVGHIPQRATAETKADASALAQEISDAARAAHRSAHEDEWAEAAAHVKQGQASLAKLKARFNETPK